MRQRILKIEILKWNTGMTLRQMQSKFAHMAALLILHGEQLGFEITLGDAYRDDRCDYGAKNSQHRKRLAVDLNLFKDGQYLSSTESHRPLGEYWEGLDPNNRWGGRFQDGNHYETQYNG